MSRDDTKKKTLYVHSKFLVIIDSFYINTLLRICWNNMDVLIFYSPTYIYNTTTLPFSFFCLFVVCRYSWIVMRNLYNMYYIYKYRLQIICRLFICIVDCRYIIKTLNLELGTGRRQMNLSFFSSFYLLRYENIYIYTYT